MPGGGTRRTLSGRLSAGPSARAIVETATNARRARGNMRGLTAGVNEIVAVRHAKGKENQYKHPKTRRRQELPSSSCLGVLVVQIWLSTCAARRSASPAP